MHDPLSTMIDHMRWADGLVADALERDAVDEAIRLFAHIASVEHLWFARIHGRTPDHAVWPEMTVADARALAAEHADRFAALLAVADAEALARRVAYRNSQGVDFTSSVGEIITHTAMHGVHHRGQILRVLRAAGHEPPYVDYIQYTRLDQIT
jgi:uncharacterized damage-inducible protein DinB